MHTLPPCIKLGIDGLNLTVPAANATAKEVAFGLFGLPLAKWYPVPVPREFKKFYGEAYQLISAETIKGKCGGVLCMMYTDYLITSGKGRAAGKHHHIQVHGHALAASALNPFNPSAHLCLPDIPGTSLADAVPSTSPQFNLNSILHFVAKYRAKITELHLYLDLYGFDVPFAALLHQAKSEDFRDYFQSPFLRVCNHKVWSPLEGKRITVHGVPAPFCYDNGIYIGRYGLSYSQIYAYEKRHDINHRISDQVQQLKYTWHRVEVRLRGQVGHKAGKSLMVAFSSDPGSIEKFILQRITDYVAFTSPDGPTKRDKPLQDWWLRAVTMAEQSLQEVR